MQLVFPSRPQSLYVCLPALLECPPFQTERRESWCSAPQLPEELRHVVSVYQATMDLLRQFRVHPEIASQVLAYLFFFSSTLLFNQLLDKGEGRVGGGWGPLPLLREKPSGCWRALGVLRHLTAWGSRWLIEAQESSFCGRAGTSRSSTVRQGL